MARAKKTARRGKKSTVSVNFKDVESRQTPPEGDYPLKVLEAVSDTGPSGDMIVFTLEITKGKYKGQKVWFYCPLAENSLWKLHGFLTALGVEVPADDMDIDLDELVDLEVIGVLTHETYNGRKRAKMTDFDSVENYKGEAADDDEDEDDEDDDKKSKKSKSKKKSKKSDDDEDEDDEDDKKSKGKKAKGKKSKSDDDDEDEDEEDEKKSKKSKSKRGKSKKSDDDDDDEDEDDKKSKSKKSKSKKKAKKLDRDEVSEMDEDELQELIEEHDLEVDLDDFKKLPKKVAAVLEALEENDLVEEEDDD